MNRGYENKKGKKLQKKFGVYIKKALPLHPLSKKKSSDL